MNRQHFSRRSYNKCLYCSGFYGVALSTSVYRRADVIPTLTRTRSEHEHGSEAAADGRHRQTAPGTGEGLHGHPRQRGARVRRPRHGQGRAVLHPELLHPDGRDRCFTIGQHPDWSVTAARARARELRREIDAGGDPLAEIEAERDAPTVAELIDRFEAEHLPRKRAITAQDYGACSRTTIRPHFGQHTKVADVTFADIDALHRKISKAGARMRANRSVAILSKMFSLAVRWGMRETNPCKGIERNTEHHRRRYLSGDELGRLVAALAEHPDRQAADAVRLLLLTGARRGEVLGMRWADIDLTAGTWSKPPSSTKQNATPRGAAERTGPRAAGPHPRGAGRAARNARSASSSFPSTGATGHLVEIKKSWATLTKAAGIKNLRLHDLRHSLRHRAGLVRRVACR